MEYSNKYEAIRMPEYGRHIQKMVDYTLMVEDRARKQALAEGIVQTMQGLVPELKDTPSGKQIYWDHLAIISKFQLDIDFPEGTLTEEGLNKVIEKPSYTCNCIKYRYYGHFIEAMVKEICAMPRGKERAELEYFIAVQMKRGYMTWNSEIVEDLKIFNDLYEMSAGEIMLTPENCKLVINPNSIDRGGRQKVSKKQAPKTPTRTSKTSISKGQKRK